MPSEMTVNQSGGKQHKVEHRCEALFPKAILEVARLRAEGHDKNGYDDHNYELIPVEEHIGRALRHILLWMDGDREDGTVDEHLVHACCRLMMAIEITAHRESAELEALRLEYGYTED